MNVFVYTSVDKYLFLVNMLIVNIIVRLKKILSFSVNDDIFVSNFDKIIKNKYFLCYCV